MTTENIQTEELIKETAKRLFFQKGHIHATTQEIANEAGVNRALIHYYFRSRDLLFEKVLDETIGVMHKKMDSIFLTNDSLRVKISRFIDAFIDQNIDYPYLENFLITEMAKSPEKIKQLPNQEKKEEFKKFIEKQLSDEIAAGTMAPIKLEHFIVNLMSMCNYPLLAKPLIQNAFGFDEHTYKNFLLERKRVVYRTIFNEDLPE
ncbi:TetR/AcrR family transcriptional regulator [Ohtaekwangia koreensis]|uniref:Transcriptional regulator, TetR family n=1 Tax=Ohtaekwangia koreensis TaxID=688867 RepID=A0A1T5MLT0_9BACT|nr:TetR/AcrR family transcriptional regulator [Ohtaekwangia koreensis]SKC89197.1 transcriptional regulator, TetR family [Ohtaekwangia koreensis]